MKLVFNFTPAPKAEIMRFKQKSFIQQMMDTYSDNNNNMNDNNNNSNDNNSNDTNSN